MSQAGTKIALSHPKSPLFECARSDVGRRRAVGFLLRQGDGGKSRRALSAGRSEANPEETGPQGDALVRYLYPPSLLIDLKMVPCGSLPSLLVLLSRNLCSDLPERVILRLAIQ